MKYALICAVVTAVFFSCNAFAADSETESLQQQLNSLQEQLKTIKGVKDTSKNISGENTGNPAISVIGSFTGHRSRGGNNLGSSSFLPLSETEIVFGANIDPHARLDITATAADGGMAVEEGFITAYLPKQFNLKAGRKFLPIGRANEVHPHALIYADRPNGLVNLFGPEIFIGSGLLLDRPFFTGNSIQSLTIGLFSTSNDIAFDPTGINQYAGLIRGTSVWDTSDWSTLELGATYLQGKNGITSDSATKLSSAHLSWKSQSLDDTGLSIEAEWIRRTQEQGANAPSMVMDGSYLLADVGFNKNMHVFARADYSKEHATTAIEKAISAGIVWKVSEFQNLTLQYKQTRNALAEVAKNIGVATGDKANTWFFRWVVAIGPHATHAY